MFGCVLTVTAVSRVVVIVVGIENGDAWWCTEKRKDDGRDEGRRGERSIVGGWYGFRQHLVQSVSPVRRAKAPPIGFEITIISSSCVPRFRRSVCTTNPIRHVRPNGGYTSLIGNTECRSRHAHPGRSTATRI